jgi:hypothetical protein
MFDFPLDHEDEHIPYGMILEGTQKPSEVLDAMLPYLEWASHKSLEWGGDLASSHSPFIVASGLLLLAKSSPHFDVSLDDDGDGDYGLEMDVLTFHALIRELMEHLDGYTAPGQRFGFSEGDLGVWTDWPVIDRMIERGECAEIDHPDDLDDLEAPVRFALLDDGERLSFYAMSDGATIWSI